MAVEVVFLRFSGGNVDNLKKHMETLLRIKGIKAKMFELGSVSIKGHTSPESEHILLKLGDKNLYKRLVNDGRMRNIYLGFRVPVYVQFGKVTLPPPAWIDQFHESAAS